MCLHVTVQNELHDIILLQLLDTYKRQYDKARRSSLRRGGTLKSSHRWPPIAPHQWETRSLRLERAECTPDSIQSSEDSFPHSLTSG